MIDLTNHKDAGRVLRNAVLDDVTPAERGTEYMYWRGETDVNPTGYRKAVFDAARGLSDSNRVILYQRRVDDGVYEYIAGVV